MPVRDARAPAAVASSAERLLRFVHLLEHDVAVILEMVERALASVPADDPMRSDLEELRVAARQALAKTEALVARAEPIARPR